MDQEPDGAADAVRPADDRGTRDGEGSGVIDEDDLRRVVKTALEEDLRYGPDATTTATVPADAVATATISPRAFGTLAGLPAVQAVFDEVIGSYDVLSTMDDGAKIRPGD